MSTKTIAEILEQAKLPERTVPLCMRADVQADIEEKERLIHAIQNADSQDLRMSSPDEAADLAEEIRELEKLANESTISLRLRAQRKKKWAAYVAAHTGEEDKLDITSLMSEVVPASIISPSMTEDERDKMLDLLTDGQWQTIYNAIWSLNRGEINIPKSLTATTARPTKEQKPGPVEPSE